MRVWDAKPQSQVWLAGLPKEANKKKQKAHQSKKQKGGLFIKEM
jgi:hypothetical protein